MTVFLAAEVTPLQKRSPGNKQLSAADGEDLVLGIGTYIFMDITPRSTSTFSGSSC